MFHFLNLIKNIFLKKNIDILEEPNLLFWTKDDTHFHTSIYCSKLKNVSNVFKGSTDSCVKKEFCSSCKERDSLK